MRTLVEELCSDRCAGRETGTPGGRAARELVVAALRDGGLDPGEQPIPGNGGANVLAAIPGEIDRWILVAAHYDHLGTAGRRVFRGADDNAASVAVLAEIAGRLAAARPAGRGVILAGFDAEEPPHFLTPGMGSEHFARHPTVPLERIDLMVCLELVGHPLGEPGLPAPVRQSLFALGAERSRGTAETLDEVREPGLTVRRADAEIIPPLSDYAGFWERSRPFVLLTGGRSRRYHTVDDTPAHLDYPRLEALARWLERFVRASCARSEEPFRFVSRPDDVSTLDSLAAILAPLGSPHLALVQQLRRRCQADGTLPSSDHVALERLVAGLETALA